MSARQLGQENTRFSANLLKPVVNALDVENVATVQDAGLISQRETLLANRAHVRSEARAISQVHQAHLSSAGSFVTVHYKRHPRRLYRLAQVGLHPL